MKNINVSSCDNYELMDNNFLHYYFDCNVICIKKLLILILLTILIITLYLLIILSTNGKYQTLTSDYHYWWISSNRFKIYFSNRYTNNYDAKMCLLIIYFTVSFMSMINRIVDAVASVFVLYLMRSMFLIYFCTFNLF